MIDWSNVKVVYLVYLVTYFLFVSYLVIVVQLYLKERFFVDKMLCNLVIVLAAVLKILYMKQNWNMLYG